MSQIDKLAKRVVTSVSKQESVAKIDLATILLLTQAAIEAIKWAVNAYRECQKTPAEAFADLNDDNPYATKFNRMKLNIAYRLKLPFHLRKYRSALVDATLEEVKRAKEPEVTTMFKEVQ